MAATAGSSERISPYPDGAEPGRPIRPTLSDRLPRAWLFPLLVFTATWLLILAAWYGSNRIYGQNQPWSWHFIFKDAKYYLGIAQSGYAHKSPFPWGRGTAIGRRTAFFPFFPLLIRLASYLTGGNYLIAGLAVSVLSGAASALGVWALAVRVRDRYVADRAVLLYCFFPGAMTFGLLYSEPLAVALGVAALLAVLDRRWLLAGIIGAAATAERPTMIVLVAVYGIAALQAIWTRREWRALIAPALAPLGMLAFFAYLGRRYHDYGFWFRAEKDGWNQHFDWGSHTLRLVLWADPGATKYVVFSVLLSLMFIAAVAGVAMMIAARLPLPVSLFGVLMVLTSIVDGSPKPRFIWVAFPLFIGAGAKLPRVIFWPLLVLSAASLAFLTGWWPHHYFGPAP